MRIMNADGVAILRRGRRRVNYNVWVYQVNKWVRLNDLYGRDWIKSIRLTEDLDSPSATLDFEVQREWESINLSPLVNSGRSGRVNNVINADGQPEFAPLLQVDARVEVYISVSSDTEWQEYHLKVFSGRISADSG